MSIIHINKRRFHISIPPIGQRILKTGIAVLLCTLVYYLRGYRGMVSQSAMAAIVCMQPYTKDSEKSAIYRALGTLLGGLWGLALLWLLREVPILSTHMLLVYLLMAVGVILSLYSTVLLKITDAAALAAIVFVCVVITYPDIEAPVLQTIDRVVDTSIGVIIALVVNVIRLPTRKHPEKLFFLRLQDLAPDRYSHVSPRTLIALNRLYDDGARICLVSKWAPAFLISQMGSLKVNMPVIVMDGAALFDIHENTFYEVIEIDHDRADYATHFIQSMNYCSCIFAVRKNAMLTFRIGEISEAEEKDFQMLRRSPYRNYVDGIYHEEDRIAVIRFIVKDEDADIIDNKLKNDETIMEYFRFSKRKQPRIDGYTGFYLYRKDATISTMEKLLIGYMKEHSYPEVNPITILPTKKNFNAERDATMLLHRIKKEYESIGIPKIKKNAAR